MYTQLRHYLHIKFQKVALKSTKETLRKKYPYSKLFWSAFSRIRTRISPNTDTFHAVRMKGVIQRYLKIFRKSHLNIDATHSEAATGGVL